MKVTLDWLKEFLDLDNLDPENIAKILTMSGSEVKEVEYIGEKYKNIVVGKIIDFSIHPNADKLYVLKIDLGKEIKQSCAGIKKFYSNFLWSHRFVRKTGSLVYNLYCSSKK